MGVTALGLALHATQAYAQDTECQNAVAIEICKDDNKNGLCDGNEKKNTTAWQELSLLLYGDFKGSQETLEKQRELAYQFAKPLREVTTAKRKPSL